MSQLPQLSKEAPSSPAQTPTQTTPSLGDENRPLDDQEYFYGILREDETNELIEKDGDFLVRESFQNETFLSCVCSNSPTHFQFAFDNNGYCILEGQSFPTIPRLVKHYYDSKVPLTPNPADILRNPIINKAQLNYDDIKIGKKIGKWDCGEFSDGTMSREGRLELVAIKTYNERDTMPMKKETQLLSRFDHPNVVKFIGTAAQRSPILFVMEWVTGGTLLSFLKEHEGSITLKQKLKFCLDAARGMEYLSNRGCTSFQRALSARRCLLDSKKNNALKIDGHIKSLFSKEDISGRSFPLKYFGQYSVKSDVWSFGILIWQILHEGTTPYKDMSNLKVMEFLEEKGQRLDAPPETPEELNELMRSCWKQKATDRPNFTAILNDLERMYQNTPD